MKRSQSKHAVGTMLLALMLTANAEELDKELHKLLLHLDDYFNNKSLSNTTLLLYGDNLLDEDIFFPSVNRKTVNSVPHHMDRDFYGTFSIDF
jgi:hypothetical protein